MKENSNPLKEIFNRDLKETSKTIRSWLMQKIDGCRDVDVTGIQGASGLSNEIIIAETIIRYERESQRRDFVFRIDPVVYRKRMESNLRREFDVLTIIGRENSVPAPEVFWYETDTSIMGAEFYVMSRIFGDIPKDQPPFQTQGWIAEMRPEDREVLWVNSLKTLASIHRLPGEKFSILRRGDTSKPDIVNHFDYWKKTYLWSKGDFDNPASDEAWVWLGQNLPLASPAGLSWGDARLANLVFDHTTCCGVLDWEDVSISSPLVDLGRWLFADRFHQESGFPRLPGFGDRSRTIELWEQYSGLSATDIRWFEIFTVACGIGLLVRMRRLQAELTGKNLTPGNMNVDVFNKILFDWLDGA